MSTTDMPAALASETTGVGAGTQSAANKWFETAVTVLFTAAAILLVSFVAVVSGLI